jgi:NAD(P)-dependent dehydrogenase (short-subunit alcohol dehydrogenase family)
MDPLLDFTNKVVVITGAAQGFGELASYELAKRGAKLVISDVNEAGINKVAAEIEANGGQVVAMTCDVSKSLECKAMIDTAKEVFGSVDMAINNAGVAHEFVRTHELEESVMDTQFAVNVKGVQFCMRYQLEQMLTQSSGIILNVSSMAGLSGTPKLSAYTAAKHAVIGLTKSAAVEYGAKNIRVNAICPFFTLTPMITETTDQETRDKMSRSTPMRRLAEPKEIVCMMLMMLSPANTFLNGQSIAIDGGMSVR